MMANFIHSLIAVLAGNGIYFLLVPYLPPEARHAASRVGVGTVLDFGICLMIFLAIKTMLRRTSKHNKTQGEL